MDEEILKLMNEGRRDSSEKIKSIRHGLIGVACMVTGTASCCRPFKGYSARRTFPKD